MEVVIKAEVTLTRSQVLVSGVFTAVSQSAVVIDQLLSVTGRQSETKPSIKVSQCFSLWALPPGRVASSVLMKTMMMMM